MTDDLVVRLREPVVCVLPDGCENLDILREAADRIEALEAALRKAMDNLWNDPSEAETAIDAVLEPPGADNE